MASNIPAHEIIIAKTPEERQQCIDMRIKVFHFEQKFPLETEIDEYEDISTHILLRLVPSLTPIGTIRGFKSPHGDYYKLTRLAVLNEYRRHRFGRVLVESLHDWAKAHALETNSTAGSVNILCHSQIPVQGFYAKFGYTPEGEQFDEEGDPHQKMVLRLPL